MVSADAGSAGITLHNSAGLLLHDVSAITATDDPIAIKINGHLVREVPGPKGLPFVGNYFEGTLATSAPPSRLSSHD